VRLVWTRDSSADLERIMRYIARDNVNAALRIHERILVAVGRLEAAPRVGRPGQVAGTRELVVTRTPYLVVYRIDDDAVVLLRVLHGAQRWPPLEGCARPCRWARIGIEPAAMRNLRDNLDLLSLGISRPWAPS
jgi:toxin ParE1/3/4